MERFEELFKSSLRWLFVAAGIAIVTASVHLFNNTGSSDAIQLLGPQLTSEDNTQTSEATSARMSAQSTTPLAGQSTHFREVDSWDRAAIVAAYNAEFFRIEPPMGFTGAVASCTAGTTNPEYRASVIQRVNWYRVMAGLQPVAEKTQYSEANQQAAVMMSNNGRLSHYPDATWKCHTEEGEISSGRSSLALGIAGVGAIDAYIADFGDNNREVGHRRTILYPQTQLVGTGDVPGSEGFYPSNTLQGFDSKIWSRRPEVPEARDFVAWPPSGYVPPETVWTRWSFSLPESNFSNANVAVKGPNGAVQAEVIARVQSKGRSAPESSIVWSMNGTTDSVPFTPVPTGGHDDCYDVTISGVMTNDGNTLAPFEYTNCILDMSLPATGAPATAHCPNLEFGAWATPCWSESTTPSTPFTDVNQGDYFFDPVRWMTANNITGGVAPDRYDPDGFVSRAQSVTFLWRLAGSPVPSADAPTFSDVLPGSYFYDAVRWAAENNITNGVAPGEFGPNRPTTRAQFVAFLWRLADEPHSAGHNFVDFTAGWQQSPGGLAASYGITNGISPTEFGPDQTVTRGQAAAFISRFVNGL